MWSLLALLMRLLTVAQALKGVNAHAPDTTAASYMPGAAIILDHPRVQQILAKLEPAAQEEVERSLPAALWLLDGLTE